MDRIRELASQHKIFPDACNPFEPVHYLHISYGDTAVSAGEYIAPPVAEIEPSVEWMTSAQNHVYTLIMINLDAPTRQNPVDRSHLHWLVSNIPGANVDKGTTHACYVQPSPKSGSGTHRCVFILCRQVQPVLDLVDFPEERDKFDVTSFIQKHNLVPVGCNFFVSSCPG